MDNFKTEELEIAIDVLRKFRNMVQDGSLDGWGFDENSIVSVKVWLENFRDGYYSS